MRPLTGDDVRDLIRLLITLLVSTLVVWLPLRLLTHLDMPVSTVYVVNAVLLLAFVTIRRRVRFRRSRPHSR